MRRAKYVIGILGVSFAVAASTPPQALADWMVNGTTLTGSAAIATTAAVDNAFVLKAGQVEVICEGSQVDMVNPTISQNMIDITGSLTLLVCIPGTSICVNVGPTINLGHLLVDLTKGPSFPWVKVNFLSTNSSKVLGTIAFEGEECSFAGVNVLKGSITALMPTGQSERTLQSLVTTSESLGSLKLASTSASLLGSALLRLASGIPFSFL